MKKKIALVTGGLSGEAVISYKSAATIGAHIDREKYDVYTIDITPGGWFYHTENDEKIPVDKNDFSIVLQGKKTLFDAVLIAIHGTPGEDGKLQGYFDLLQIPYTGCSTATSAITFNKIYGTAVAAAAGIKVAPSIRVFRHTPFDTGEILNRLRLPYFVKPNNGGSSIGMSKVQRSEELSSAIEKAFAEDSEVLIEEMIEGREFTIGVYQKEGRIITLPISEVRKHSSQVFFDFEAKYEGRAEEITPAQVDEDVAEKIRNAARKLYASFNCRGVIRIDFIYNEASGEPFMLEINTIPGQTPASFLPQQIAASGGNLKDFYTSLIEACFT